MDLPSSLLPLILAVHLVAAETLAGMLLFLHALVGPAGADDGLERWCRRLAWFCLAVMAVTMGLWLGVTAAAVTGAEAPFDFDSGTLRVLLLGTQFGLIWLLRLGAGVVLALILWRRPTRRALAEDGLPWAGLLLLTLAMTGHAGASGGHHAGGLLLPLVALHLAATSAWLGSLPPLARLVSDVGAVALAREVVRRYQTYGMAAVGLLVLSGATTAALLVDGAPITFASGWARILAGKVGLVAVMIGIGAANRFLIGPRLEGAADPVPALALLRRAALVEYAVGAFVVLGAAILSQTAPPGL